MPDPRWFPALVTGGSGFVGAGLVRRLAGLAAGLSPAADGPAPVHVLLRDPGAAWRLADLLPRLAVHRCDLADREAVTGAVAAIRPRAVFHLAAAGAHARGAGLRGMAEANLIGTLNLLEAAADAGAQVFVNAGSSSEYGRKRAPMRETDPAEPATLYALTKTAQTNLCRALSIARQLDAVTIRLFSVYGPGEKPEALIPAAVRAIRAGVELRLGDPDAAHDFLYLDDAVDALLPLDRFQGLRGEIFNAGTGVQSTNRQVVEAVQEALGHKGNLAWRAFPPREGDSPVWVADPAAAASRLGWRATVPLRDGIARTAAWMAERQDRYGPPAR